jgi:DNA-binding transcriptional ArsR family regulator
MAYTIGSLAALADPTRREIFERLSRGPQSVGALARGLPVSRPAVSQHLATLKAAGLVTDTAAGAKRIYRIDPHGLAAIRAWLDRFWTASLNAFEAEISKSEEKDR